MVVQRKRYTTPPVNFGRGAFTGYGELRNGSKRRPYLSKSPVKKIIEGQKRDAAIATTAELLRQAPLSKFQYEASVRHGLRTALVLQGHRWPLADLEAAAIVAAALSAIGAVRPSWEVGQREHTTPRENCSWCAAPLDEEQIGMRDRYCSVVCAKAALVNRDFETRAWDDELGRRALYILQREHLPRKNCKHCGRNFQPTAADGEYCSPVCRIRSRPAWHGFRDCSQCGESFHPRTAEQTFCSQECASRAHTYVEPRACPNCGKVHRPHNEATLYCSKQCAAQHRKPELGTRHCAECGQEFYPRNDQAIYCRPRCLHLAKEARKATARRAAAAAIPLKPCKHCDKPFRPRRDIDRYCCHSCRRKAEYIRLKARAVLGVFPFLDIPHNSRKGAPVESTRESNR
ncbi:MAG TPA: hypothetical protein VGM83_05745 [Devosiaceae bacterium]|jgi:hypothetical protein